MYICVCVCVCMCVKLTSCDKHIYFIFKPDIGTPLIMCLMLFKK